MRSLQELFKRWYVVPLRMLESLPTGDGAFVALVVSCALYERYAVALIKKSGGKANKEAKLQQLVQDFAVDERAAEAYWDIIRNGLAHQAMPLQEEKHPRWSFHNDHPKAFELAHISGRSVLKIQPWRFMDRVISLCESNLSLLGESESFPWGDTDVPPL